MKKWWIFAWKDETEYEYEDWNSKKNTLTYILIAYITLIPFGIVYNAMNFNFNTFSVFLGLGTLAIMVSFLIFSICEASRKAKTLRPIGLAI